MFRISPMKVFLLAVIAVLLYNSPDARNATGDILRKTANIIDTHETTPTESQPDKYTFTVPNPFAD